MVGLGRTRSSLASQIFQSYYIRRKFCLRLSSSAGFALFGGMANESRPLAELSRSLRFTPLIPPPQKKKNEKLPSEILHRREFRQNQRQSVDSKRWRRDSNRVELHYALHILGELNLRHFKEAFLKAAMSMNVTGVAPVEPFGLCFSSRRINWSQMGPNVPVIDLVLQSEMVKWRIHGRNSMVGVSGEVMCLAFVDGGSNLNPRNGIVIGGYQLEDVIVEFDLDSSMVGFSPSL